LRHHFIFNLDVEYKAAPDDDDDYDDDDNDDDDVMTMTTSGVRMMTMALLVSTLVVFGLRHKIGRRVRLTLRGSVMVTDQATTCGGAAREPPCCDCSTVPELYEFLEAYPSRFS
jgi:hypothetical protein